MQINFHAKYPVSSFKNVDRLWGGLVALEQKNTSSIILSNLTSMKVEFGQKGNECHKLVFFFRELNHIIMLVMLNKKIHKLHLCSPGPCQNVPLTLVVHFSCKVLYRRLRLIAEENWIYLFVCVRSLKNMKIATIFRRNVVFADERSLQYLLPIGT